MSYSEATYAADGAKTSFDVPFDYLSATHIHVYFDGVEHEYTHSNTYTVSFATPPTNGTIVKVRRITPINEPLVDYANGSVLCETDLDTQTLQLIYAAQEASDAAGRSNVAEENAINASNNALIYANNAKASEESTLDALEKTLKAEENIIALEASTVEASTLALQEAAKINAFMYCGMWNQGLLYKQNNSVMFEGEYYICVKDTVLYTALSDGNYWQKLSLKGPQGEQGIQGEQGPQGEQGIQGEQGEPAPGEAVGIIDCGHASTIAVILIDGGTAENTINAE